MKKIFCIISAILALFVFSGCNSQNEKSVVLPSITLVKYSSDHNGYPDGSSVKQVHSIIVYTNDGKIFSKKFEGSEYQSDPEWISPDSDDLYERLTKLAEGEPSGNVPEERQKLIHTNYDKFSEWTALEMENCGTVYDYTGADDLYVVFEDGGKTRVEKLAKMSALPECRGSAAARDFAGEFLSSMFPSN